MQGWRGHQQHHKHHHKHYHHFHRLAREKATLKLQGSHTSVHIFMEASQSGLVAAQTQQEKKKCVRKTQTDKQMPNLIYFGEKEKL